MTGAFGGRGYRLDFDGAAMDALLRSSPVARQLDTVGGRAVQEAKRLAPVSPDGSHGRPSGWLRSHIGHEVGEDSEGVFVDVSVSAYAPDGFDYGLAQEVGTSLMDAQPYLRPAVDSVVGLDGHRDT